MAASDRRRRALFIAAVAVLVGWGAAVALLGPGSGAQDAGAGGEGRGGPRTVRARSAADPARPAGAGPALRFLAAYLRYERGAAGRTERRTLARLSTPAFARQLLRVPVRTPAGGAPQPEWVSRVAGVRVGIFEGREAILVGVVVVGTGGAHVLTPTLVRRGGRWLVAGVGA